MGADPEPEGGLDDFDRVVASFNRHQVEFMIIGGWAVVYHGHVRETEDLDLFIRRSKINAEGVDFEQAWPRCETGAFGAETVRYISREDLIKNKRAVARPKDLNDALELEGGGDGRP